MSADPQPASNVGATTRRKRVLEKIKSICVYCGSGPGDHPAFMIAARAFGKVLAENNIRLVYGGGENGLMGAIANAVVDHGGKVLGVIPESLCAREGAFRRGQLEVVENMHQRKQKFFDESEAFVALPGGAGTLEETVEQMTWLQIGHSSKPIVLANIIGFWYPLIYLLKHMRTLKFIREGLEFNQLVANEVGQILPVLFGNLPSQVPIRYDGNGFADGMRPLPEKPRVVAG